jgi:hypothetical protein
MVIDRRLKENGMSWSTEGVNNLLKLGNLWYNTHNSDEFWSKQQSYGAAFPPTSTAKCNKWLAEL